MTIDKCSFFNWFVFSHKCPQNSNFIVHMRLKAKIELFSESQLIEIVIQTLLRDADHLGSLL
jgi:hypothetical protein